MHMFDLTDDVENSPTQSTEKAKPAEVKTVEQELKELDKKILEDEKPKKETPKNDEFNEYDYSDDKELDDTQW